MSNENSELIDEVRARSAMVAESVRESIDQPHVAAERLWDALAVVTLVPSPLLSPSPPPPATKMLAAGAGLQEHIAWLQKDIRTYIEVINFSVAGAFV